MKDCKTRLECEELSAASLYWPLQSGSVAVAAAAAVRVSKSCLTPNWAGLAITQHSHCTTGYWLLAASNKMLLRSQPP